VVDIAAVAREKRPSIRRPEHSTDTTDTVADDGKRRAGKLGDKPGFQLAELRPANKEYLVDADHAPAHFIRGALRQPI
jgi:hypothetical protein